MSHYDKENYVIRDPDPEVWRHHANHKIMQEYKEYLTGHVADLGCNHGACTLLLNEFPAVMSTHGVDINERALEVAMQSAASKLGCKPYHFVKANLTQLPFEDAYFSALVSFHALEHIHPEDISKVMAESYRILKPGGYYVVSIPYDHAYYDDCHVMFHTEDSLKELFEQAGFRTIECFKDDRWDEKDLLTGLFRKP